MCNLLSAALLCCYVVGTCSATDVKRVELLANSDVKEKIKKENSMELRIYPDPVLLNKCAEVEIGDPTVKEILNEMADKLYKWNGVGLAAPQVGILKKIVVIDVRDEPPTLYKMINPKIVWYSADSLVESKEGCLSLPGLSETVLRYEKVKVEYLDENFNKCELEAEGLLSFCLQHELDHLEGKLYIDHLSQSKRDSFLDKFIKLQASKPEENKHEN